MDVLSRECAGRLGQVLECWAQIRWTVRSATWLKPALRWWCRRATTAATRVLVPLPTGVHTFGTSCSDARHPARWGFQACSNHPTGRFLNHGGCPLAAAAASVLSSMPVSLQLPQTQQHHATGTVEQSAILPQFTPNPDPNPSINPSPDPDPTLTPTRPRP